MTSVSVFQNSGARNATGIDVQEAILKAKERLSAMNTEQRVCGANNANRWLSSLLGSVNGGASQDDGLSVRM